MIDAKVICDSTSPQGHRLTTFKLRYPKFIHGEFMTHRVISRNASSSRAIPVSRMIAEVRSDARASPVYWGAEQKGMQSGAELSEADARLAQGLWGDGAAAAAALATRMVDIGLHKSIVNRVLEPYLHINVVASATEWMNFFGLRLDRAAQPEMRTLAESMWRAYGESSPLPLTTDHWHLPFVDECTWEYLPREEWLSASIKVSVARCARVSYESFETGKRSTIAEDLALYERLVGAQPLHASPAEHQATPDIRFRGRRLCPMWHGNFVGWQQYRKMLPGEACAPLPEGYTA
jgi:thymidylate synthase ThyX